MNHKPYGELILILVILISFYIVIIDFIVGLPGEINVLLLIIDKFINPVGAIPKKTIWNTEK